MKLKRKKYLIVLILVLFFSIGFALLSSSLSITGLGIFKPNTWDIHFANLVDDGSEAELTLPATIEDDGLNINFDVDLNNLGDNYYFYVDIVNDGTIDAMIDNWKLSGITSDVENFIKASVTYADGVELNNYDLLPKKSNDKLKVAVEYSDEFVESTNDLPQMDGSITLTLNINYIQADEKATVRQKRADTDSPVVRVKQNEKSVQGNNRWYKNLTLSTKLIDPSGISSAKYCATTSDSCTPDNPVVLKNNTFDIRLDNSKTPWTICVETVDNEENTENYCDKNKYYVDGEDPIVSNITVTPADLSMRIELTSKDNHSGVDKYYYSKDGGASYISSDKPNYTFSSLDANDYIVMAYVEDVAGNKSDTVTETTTVREYSWCEKNGITKLGDCAIATEVHNADIATAKQEIEEKGQPDFSKTSPTYTYKEKHSSSPTTMTTGNSTFYFSTSYTFDKNTGQYTLSNATISEIGNVNLEDGENHFSCIGSITQCNKLYKLDSYKQESDGSYKISKYDYTSDVDTYDISGVGMYEAEDDLGKSYYYRGSVGGNFVKFANKYWRILRINGDGSVRLMYFSDSSTTQGKEAITSHYNDNYWDPTYVGLMYNDTDFSDSELISTTANYNDFNENTVYYYGKDYSWDASAKMFKLSGTVEDKNIISGNWKDTYEQITSGKYIYTCFGKSEDSTCPVLMKITGYNNVNTAKVEFISYSSTSYEKATKNLTKSILLNNLEKWYRENIENQRDSENTLYSDYIVNSIFCNDRSLSQSTTGNGYSLSPTTHYGAHYRLLNNNKAPSYRCSNINRDGFTLKASSIGNGLLEYPIGTLTADEVAHAGGVNGQINALYFMNYNDNKATWTISPSYVVSTNGHAGLFNIVSDGRILVWGWTDSSYGIRPVISLSKDVLISSGDGTADNPYTVKLN